LARAGRSHNNADALSRRPCFHEKIDCTYCSKVESKTQLALLHTNDTQSKDQNEQETDKSPQVCSVQTRSKKNSSTEKVDRSLPPVEVMDIPYTVAETPAPPYVLTNIDSLNAAKSLSEIQRKRVILNVGENGSRRHQRQLQRVYSPRWLVRGPPSNHTRTRMCQLISCTGTLDFSTLC
jgi:hypothetical protein